MRRSGRATRALTAATWHLTRQAETDSRRRPCRSQKGRCHEHHGDRGTVDRSTPVAPIVQSARAAARNLIKRHPVLAFYVLAFAISWAGMLLVIGGPGNFPGTSAQVERLFLSVMLAWLAGPSVASIVVTGFVDGKAGYRKLLARLLRWRVGARWYAVALLAAPLMYVALAFALSLTSAEFLPGILVTSDRSALAADGFRRTGSWAEAFWRSWAGRGSPCPG